MNLFSPSFEQRGADQSPSVEWDLGPWKKGDEVYLSGEKRPWRYEGAVTIDGEEKVILSLEAPEVPGVDPKDLVSTTRIIPRAEFDALHPRKGST